MKMTILFLSVCIFSLSAMDSIYIFKAQFIAHHFLLHHAKPDNNTWAHNHVINTPCHVCTYSLTDGLRAYDDVLKAIHEIKLEPNTEQS